MKRSGEVRNGNFKLPITNYEFQFCSFFLLVRILFDATAMVLPFRQGEVVVSLSAGRRPTVMKVIAFQAKGKEVRNENYKLPITNFKELSNR